MIHEEFLSELNPIVLPEIKLFESITDDLSESYSPVRVLEIGTGWGISACAFLHNPSVLLFTIDIKANRSDFDRRIDGLGYRNRVVRLFGDSREVLLKLHKLEVAPFHVIYIDGDHSVDVVREDCRNVLPLLHPFGILLFDDTNEQEYPGVLDAIKEEKQEMNLMYYDIAHGVTKVWRRNA